MRARTRAIQTLRRLVLSLVLTSSAAAVAAEGVYFNRGDANENGTVDLSDAVFTLRFLFSGEDPPTCNDAADANDSGKVDLSDAVFTLAHLFLGGPAPPAPGLTCGWDPTPDSIYCLSYSACAQPSTSFEVIDGLAIREGDIIIGRPEDFPAVPNPRSPMGAGGGNGESLLDRRWPGGVIPYVIDSNIADQNRITNAITHWEQNTQIRFKARTDEVDYVTFQLSSACASWVGRLGGNQVIEVASDCSTGNLIHELGHCVGLEHEQSRSDRDMYIDIIWDNVIPEKKDQFDKKPSSWDIGVYDFGSIMHYGANFFARKDKAGNPLTTIVTKPAGMAIGQRVALSPTDKDSIDYLYGGWREWFRIDPGFSVPAGAPVASVARSQRNVDLFVIGGDGGVYSNYWADGENSNNWHAWFRIGPGQAFPMQEVAAVSRVEGHIDLFVVGFDGVVYSAFWDESLNGSQWTSFFPIGPDTVFRVQKVAAVSRYWGHIDLFLIGNDERVWSNFWDIGINNAQWNRWFIIDPNAIFPLQDIAAVARTEHNVDLFVFGGEGRIWSNFWAEGVNGNQWQRWFMIGPDPFIPVPSRVTAVSRAWDRIDLFVVHNVNGAVYSNFWDGFSWHSWFAIEAWWHQPTHHAVIPLARTLGQIDLFGVGADGSINSNFWRDDIGWSGGFPVSAKLPAPALGMVSACARHPAHIDLFLVGSDGGIYSSFWEERRT